MDQLFHLIGGEWTAYKTEMFIGQVLYLCSKCESKVFYTDTLIVCLAASNKQCIYYNVQHQQRI